MVLLNKKIKILILSVLMILLIICIIILTGNKINDNLNNNYIVFSDVETLELKNKVIVLYKTKLNASQKSMLDIDKNNRVDNNDCKIFKDIVNDTFKDINQDGIINNKDLELLKKIFLKRTDKENIDYDLNYDKEIDELDVDLLQRYITGVIDLDINQDQKENYEDIIIFEQYINSKKQLQVLLPRNSKDTKVTWDIENDNIVKIDNDAVLYSKEEGITKLTIKDDKGNTDDCIIVVVDYNTSEENININKSTIYLKPAHLTTVQLSASDINKDKLINAVDLRLLKDIIKLQFGNIDDDKVVNDEDLRLLNQYIKGKENINGNYNKLDINKDGLVDMKDYNLLNDYLYGDKMGDVNKDNQVENRDIKLISDYINSYYPLHITFTSNTTNTKKITWKSSDTNVATVTPEGIVYAHKEGSAVITATTSNGLTKECKVVVSSTTNVPYKLESNHKEIMLKYFDYKTNDILKSDFNNDGIIDNVDKKIMNKLLNIKDLTELSDKLLSSLINKDKYIKDYDIDQDDKITIQDYVIIYNFITKEKNGDVNNDNNFNQNDIDLINNYMESKKKIKTKVDGTNSMNRVLYLTENANISSVDDEGYVKALRKGTTTITTMTVNGIAESIKIIVE